MASSLCSLAGTGLADCDQTDHLTHVVREAFAQGQPLAIGGAGSKSFLGNAVSGRAVSVAGHQGIVAYEPTELVLTARAGTSLETIETTIAQGGQMLGCEPPRFGGSATAGGVVAAGLSGPGRPYWGGVRDCVLGIRMLNGQGQLLNFGGQVMKNVAGFDVSRLLCGSMGSLGVLLEVTFKLRPRPRANMTRVFELPLDDARRRIAAWTADAVSMTGATWSEGLLRVRLSGADEAVIRSSGKVGGELGDDSYWVQLRDHELSFFEQDQSIWMCRKPRSAPMPDLPGQALLDWSGALCWLSSSLPAERIRAAASRVGGFAWPYRLAEPGGARLVRDALVPLHRRICQAFDPKGILNPGRLHPELSACARDL